jgi:Flp pilus assembly protein TadD
MRIHACARAMLRMCAASASMCAVSACVLDNNTFSALPEPTVPAITPTIQDPADIKFLRSDESRKLGLEHFNRGDYGVAERYFRDAVEKAPTDGPAWVGLAATYDRIGRFDLADRAYKTALRLNGETTELLNNLGYSYMLRGQFATARRYMMKAFAREPNNPTIVNNLQLLDSMVPPTQR